MRTASKKTEMLVLMLKQNYKLEMRDRVGARNCALCSFSEKQQPCQRWQRKRNNQKLRSEGLSNMSKDTQLGSRGAAAGVFIFLHEARSFCVMRPSNGPGDGYNTALSQKELIGWRVEVKVAQSCPTPCDPMDYTVHGILQDRILEWVAFPFSKGSSQPRDWTQVSHIAGGFFTSWATREAQENWSG